METAVGWPVKVKRKVGVNKTVSSWITRKASVDLERSLVRLENEQKMKMKQIDAEINRMRNKFLKTKGASKEELIVDNSLEKRLSPHQGLEKNNSFVTGGSSPAIQVSEVGSGSLSAMRTLDQKISSNPSLHLSKDEISNKHSQTLSQLLITNGEIDLNKILALHLVAVSLPSVPTQGALTQGGLSPVTRYANLLPSYILSPKTICRCRGKCKCNDIRPQEMTVSVNSQIEMIVMTAIQVLARLSRAKLHILITLAHNPIFLKTLMSDEVTKQQTMTIQESGIMNSANYLKNYSCTVVKANSNSMGQYKEKKNIVFKMLLPHHYPVFQIPVFSLRSSTGALIGDRDESVPVLLNLYKQVTLGKPIEDEDSGLSVLPDFCNTRLAIISDDGTDFALISKSGNIVKPSSMSLTENLAALVRNTSRMEDLKKESEDPYLNVNYNPRPKFSKNPAVMMESLIGLAKENLGLSVKPPRTRMGISEVQRRRMESEQLRCSILRRLSNTERMAIAKEAAKTTQNQKEMMRKSEKSKLENFSTLMSSVMPKRSIMSLARNCSRKERDFMFKPLNKGGLGFGDLILKENVLAQIEGLDSKTKKESSQGAVGHLPSLITNVKSQTLLIESDRVRTEIVGAELKEKVKRFVGSDIVLKRFKGVNSMFNVQAKSEEAISISPSENFNP